MSSSDQASPRGQTSGAGVPDAADQGIDKRVVLGVICLSSFLTAMMSSSVNIAIPSIGREFGADAITLSWVATGFLLALGVVLVPLGKAADIYGRKRVFLIGSVAWVVTSLLCGLATSVSALIGFRALQGMASAAFGGTSSAIVTSVYSPRERGQALGIAVAAVYIGLSAGPFVGGVMTQQLGWRSMFLLSAVLGALMVGVIIWKMRAEWAEARGQKLDLVGSGLFAAALLPVMYGFSVLPALPGAGLIAAGLACLAIFVWWEDRVANPVLDIRLFRHNAVFAVSNLAALINYAATFAIGFLLSLYLQYVKGLTPQTAGLILLAQPVIMAVFSPITGRLSDRIEPRVVASAGMAITTVGLVMLAFLGDSSGLGYIVGALVVAGFGFALFSSPNTNAIMGSVERSVLGVASATLSVFRSVGQMLSMGIATLIIAVYVGGVAISPENHAAFSSAFRLSFIIFSALCLVGIFASLKRGDLHTPTARAAASTSGSVPALGDPALRNPRRGGPARAESEEGR